jgi:hypothetical protein
MVGNWKTRLTLGHISGGKNFFGAPSVCQSPVHSVFGYGLNQASEIQSVPFGGFMP